VGEELASAQVDLVVSHFAFYTFPVLGLIASQRRPLVVHFHGPWGAESRLEGAGRVAGGLKAMVERRVYRRAKRLIVLCDPYRRMLVSDFGVAEDRIRRVPPGMDTARFHTGLSRIEARERLGWSKDRPIVFVVRRLVSRMGLEDLIDAVVDVRKRVPEVLVLIAGKGRLSASLQERINSGRLHEHIKLLGFVPDADLPVAYTAADLTVVPTVALEGFGMVVIESLAAGTPVLVTPVGGLPDGIIGLAPDLVLPSNGAAALTEGMVGVLKGKTPVPTREECREHAEKNFDWRVIANKVRGVYEEALRDS
jgi:glycosyltransferase involved in cell wall biosynthesis